MINRILFFILTRIYKVDPKMCLISNWRVAHPAEGISNELRFSPLVYKEAFPNKIEVGFLGVENFIFIGLGKVFLVPILDEGYFNKEDDQDHINEYQRERISRGAVPYTLFQHYIHNDPHVVVKKFPTKLLIKLLKRQIEIQRQNSNQNENLDESCSLSNAIQSDLRNASTVSAEDVFDKHQRFFGKG